MIVGIKIFMILWRSWAHNEIRFIPSLNLEAKVDITLYKFEKNIG
jgi:hypothetical protein